MNALEQLNEIEQILLRRSVDTGEFDTTKQINKAVLLIQKLRNELKEFPSVGVAGIIAVGIAEKLEPRLTTQEEALFIAGFQECIKYLEARSFYQLNHGYSERQIKQIEKLCEEAWFSQDISKFKTFDQWIDDKIKTLPPLNEVKVLSGGAQWVFEQPKVTKSLDTINNNKDVVFDVSKQLNKFTCEHMTDKYGKCWMCNEQVYNQNYDGKS